MSQELNTNNGFTEQPTENYRALLGLIDEWGKLVHDPEVVGIASELTHDTFNPELNKALNRSGKHS